MPDNTAEKQPNQRVPVWMKDISNFPLIKYQMGCLLHNSDVQEKLQLLQTSLPVPMNKTRQIQTFVYTNMFPSQNPHHSLFA